MTDTTHAFRRRFTPVAARRVSDAPDSPILVTENGETTEYSAVEFIRTFTSLRVHPLLETSDPVTHGADPEDLNIANYLGAEFTGILWSDELGEVTA